MAGKPARLARVTWINGLPGIVSLEHDGLPQTTALAIDDRRIVAIHVMRNPDKLGHLTQAVH